MLDRANFFAAARTRLFDGRLKQFQVDGLTLLLDEAQRRKMGDSRQLAYVLATVHHETAATMQPIREIGRGQGRPYGVPDAQTGKTYYGRGYVQLTWKANYRRLGERLGVDLVADPDRALRADVAAAILFEGMQHGLFTGRSLGEFFAGARADWTGARRIVNGTDRAGAIADLARAYHAALIAAATARQGAASEPAPGLAELARRLFAALATLFTKRSDA